jgi:uncharacterized protein YjbI with pentapeptide repeats
MTAPRAALLLLASLAFATGANATAISPGAVIPCSVHDGENHIAVNGSNADISGGSFVGTNLRNTTFVGTNFSGADFTNANLRNTDATGANFSNTDLTSTLLRDGTFANAIFDGTVMTGNLLNADFDGASFLNGADLSAATNWATSSWNGALFDGTTVLPAGFDPVAAGMVFVAEPHTAAMLGLGLLGLGVAGRRPRQA